MIAFDLTGYICDRLRPDAAQARLWLERIIRVLLTAGVPPERRDDVAAAVLTVLGMSLEYGLGRWARGCLLRLGVDFAGPPPSHVAVRGYQTVLRPQTGFPEMWLLLRDLRTFQEQVRAYLEALRTGKPSDDYRDLQKEAREEWPALQAALTSPEARSNLLFANGSGEACPVHHIRLPSGEIYRLHATGIATTKNCCHKILIWKGA